MNYHSSLALTLPLVYFAISCGMYGALYTGKALGLLDETRLRDHRASCALINLISAPFSLFAWLVLVLRRVITREAIFDEVAPGIYLGALPLPWDRGRYREVSVASVVNLCFEFPAPMGYPAGVAVHYLPTLDSTPPEAVAFAQAVDWAEAQVRDGQGLLVHCAAGHGRSTTLVAALLIRLGQFETLETCRDHLRSVRPGIYLTRAQWRLLEAWIQ